MHNHLVCLRQLSIQSQPQTSSLTSEEFSLPKSLIHPGNIRWNLKITQMERKLIFQTSIFELHVNFPACKHFGVCFFGGQICSAIICCLTLCVCFMLVTLQDLSSNGLVDSEFIQRNF